MMSDERNTAMLSRIERRIQVCAVSSQLLDALKRMSRCALRARTLTQRKLRVMNRIITAHIDPTSNKIKVLNMHANKALEFLVVVLPGAGHMPAVREVEK